LRPADIVEWIEGVDLVAGRAQWVGVDRCKNRLLCVKHDSAGIRA
jgi:hypothetical protein